MEGFSNILDKVYQMTAISSIVEEPSFLVMYLIAFLLLYLGIVKKYEPLLLIPIAFGVLIANFPGCRYLRQECQRPSVQNQRTVKTNVKRLKLTHDEQRFRNGEHASADDHAQE